MRLKLIILFVFVTGNFLAQQQPQYTNYIFNQFAINPALAGSKACLDATFGYRNQWVGFEGAPKTAFGSVHTVLKQNRFNLDKKHAIGVLLVNDTYGPFKRAKFKIAYAYHFNLTREILMSMGLFLGLEQLSFQANKVTLINYNDNAVGRAANSLVFPEVTPGVFLQGEKWFGGLAINQVVKAELKAVGTAESQLLRHAALTGGLNFAYRKKWTFVPSMLVKLAPAVPAAVDVNLTAEYKNKFGFGLSYRNVDAVAALLKIKAFDFFTFGYSFDFTLSKIQAGASNTHEIIIGINPCGNKSKSKYACPSFY